MSFEGSADAYDLFDDASLGMDLLRAEVVGDGGREGLFEAFRRHDAARALVEKYDVLLHTAVTLAQREENIQRSEDADPDWVEKAHEDIQRDQLLSPGDAAAYLTALMLHRTAFPEEYLAEE